MPADDTNTVEDRRRASLTLADRAHDRDELLEWLDMLGLPPCERPMRTSAHARKYFREVLADAVE